MAFRQMRGNLSGLSGGFLNPVGILSSLGIASMILWCKLMGHTSGFFVPLAGLGAWANARVFWLVGILLAAVACFALPRALRSADTTQRFVFPMIAVAGAMSFALAFYQDIFDQRTLAMLGLVVSGFGYFWFISRFVLLLALTQGIACLAWAFSCAFVLRQVLLIVMDALIPINHQVMVAIALPLSAIACLEGACLLGRRADARSAPPGADGQANMLWGIRTLPKERHIDARSGRYLIVILAAVALLLSVARACSISGTWGNDHTADLDLSVAIPLVVLYAALVFGLVYLGVIRTARLGDVPRFLVGVLVVMTGLLVAALRPALDPTPSVALDVFVNTNDPFALVFFWSTVAVAVQRLSVRPNRVIGFAGALYAAASIVWVFLINDANAVSSTFVLTAVYVLLALSIVVLQLKEGPGDAGRVAAVASGAAPVVGAVSEVAPEVAERVDSVPSGTGAALSDAGTEDDSGEAVASAIKARCAAVAREHGLSPRERDVLCLMAQGKSGSSIQEELGIAASTVKTHTQHIYAKLGVGDRQELMGLLLDVR